MITIKDIARECNVSFSTVSKALKNSPEISEEKTKFIQDTAEKMGYRPNVAARSLRTNRTYDIGVIFEDKTGAGFQHQYFATVISGIQKVAQQKGYEMTFISGDSTKSYDYYYDKKHTAIMSDYEKGMEELLEYVYSMGHTKVAMIYGENTLVTKQRIRTFENFFKERNIKIPDSYFLEGLYHDPLTSAEATNILLSMPDTPTCIFYPDDYAAIGGIRALSSRDITLGKDISIVGYDGILLTNMMLPSLTTYEQSGEEIGKRIAENLIENIEKGNDYQPVKELITGRLLKGGTVGNQK